MKKYGILISILSVFLLSFSSISGFELSVQMDSLNSNTSIWGADIIVTSDRDPYYAILASTISCYYSQDRGKIIRPLLLVPESGLLNQHYRFINQFDSDNPSILCLGKEIDASFDTECLIDSPVNLSLKLAGYYPEKSKAIIASYGNISDYTAALIASPLSSYLHIPIIFEDDNYDDIIDVLIEKGIKDIYIIGDVISDYFYDFNITVFS